MRQTTAKQDSTEQDGTEHDTAPRRGRHISRNRVVRRAAVAVALAGLLLAGGAVAGIAVASQTGRPAARPTLPSAAAQTRARDALPPIPPSKWAAVPSAVSHQVPLPTGLVIPAIGVRSRLIRLGITKAGTLQVPGTTTVAGWFTGSPRPGEPGGAVIAGHIDSYQGPGVFYRLSLLRPGNRVYVRRANGSLAVFAVTSVRSYLKTRFPTGAVYGPTPNAQLRLITCGGTFDAATGHYLSNTIVYADLVR